MFNPRKILIIRFSALGDLVLTSPIYRELKRVYPQAEITLLSSSGIGSVLENNPHIDHYISHSRQESPAKLSYLIRKLRQEEFELIYDAHRSLRSIWIVWNLSGFGLFKSPQVWSINKRSWKRSLLIRFKINFLKNSPSQREHLLRPLQDRTKIELKNHTELFPDNDAVLAVKEFMEQKKLMPNRFIAIGASASYPLKCWPMQNFHVLISDLIANRWPVVLVGGANEKENTQLEKEYRGEIHNTAGKLSPLESAELLKNARLVVTNDTSVSHLAEAVSTPVIVLFGSTVKEFGYAPFLEESQIVETKEVLNCRPCSRDGRGKCLNPNYLSCLTNITPQSVMTLIPESENKYTVLYED